MDCNLAKDRYKDRENVTLRLRLRKYSVSDIRTPVKVSLKRLGSRTPAPRALRVEATGGTTQRQRDASELHQGG